jgi:hypothetical protein
MAKACFEIPFMAPEEWYGARDFQVQFGYGRRGQMGRYMDFEVKETKLICVCIISISIQSINEALPYRLSAVNSQTINPIYNPNNAQPIHFRPPNITMPNKSTLLIHIDPTSNKVTLSFKLARSPAK